MSLSADNAKALSEARMSEACLLLDRGLFSGAYYLSGYAVELGLKGIIAAQILAGTIPDKTFIQNVHTHNLSNLLNLAGLSQIQRDQCGKDPTFATNWLVATQWSESSRYEMIDQFQAREMVNAIADPVHGVFPWLKTHW